MIIRVAFLTLCLVVLLGVAIKLEALIEEHRIGDYDNDDWRDYVQMMEEQKDELP